MIIYDGNDILKCQIGGQILMKFTIMNIIRSFIGDKFAKET